MTHTPSTEEFNVPVKLFDLGRIVVTPAAFAACSLDHLRRCLALHLRGDWGCLGAEDRKANFDALFSGARILSAYPIDPGEPCSSGENTLWIVTRGDRSATAILLPEEY